MLPRYANKMFLNFIAASKNNNLQRIYRSWQLSLISYPFKNFYRQQQGKWQWNSLQLVWSRRQKPRQKKRENQRGFKRFPLSGEIVVDALYFSIFRLSFLCSYTHRLTVSAVFSPTWLQVRKKQVKLAHTIQQIALAFCTPLGFD